MAESSDSPVLRLNSSAQPTPTKAPIRIAGPERPTHLQRMTPRIAPTTATALALDTFCMHRRQMNSDVMANEASAVGSETTVGPFAYIRPGSRIGKGCKVGDFVEVKNSTLGDGTKSAHLTYIGDADLGKNINLGCGVVFVNYDGTNKYRSTVGDGAFIGCNANIVSPVSIGDGAYIAAGSTVTKNVEEDALCVARARQKNIQGWAKQRGLYRK